MAVAMIYPEPEKGGRGEKRKFDLPFSKMLLSQARAVVSYPDLTLPAFRASCGTLEELLQKSANADLRRACYRGAGRRGSVARLWRLPPARYRRTGSGASGALQNCPCDEGEKKMPESFKRLEPKGFWRMRQNCLPHDERSTNSPNSPTKNQASLSSVHRRDGDAVLLGREQTIGDRAADR
jgi:hypothetical protein